MPIPQGLAAAERQLWAGARVGVGPILRAVRRFSISTALGWLSKSDLFKNAFSLHPPPPTHSGYGQNLSNETWLL